MMRRKLMISFLLMGFVLAFDVVGKPTAASSATADRQLTIIHTSSTSNHIQEFKNSDDAPAQGGAARWAAEAQKIRAEHPNSLMLSPGDDVMGTMMFAQYGGVVSADVMSRVGYDAALVTETDIVAGGNLDAFSAYRSVAGYTLLNANLDLTTLPDVEVPAHVIKDVNGMKVGIFGLSNERGGTMAHFSQPVTVLDTDQVIKENLSYFQRQNVDIVILISSLGVERDKEVAQQYAGPHGIDVIVGNGDGALLGDPKDFVNSDQQPIGPYPLVVNQSSTPALIVYAGTFASYMGELNLTFDQHGVLKSWDGKVHFLSEDVTPDPKIQKYVDHLVSGINLDKIVIGEARQDINGSYDEYPWQETALSDLCADIYLDYGKAFGAQVALVNGGVTWGDLKKGKITLAELYQAQPYFNWLVIMDISGDQLQAALENGVASYGDPNIGAFVHPAGLTYAFDPNMPVGSRVSHVIVNGAPLDPAATYTIATNGYMADGGDNFTMLTQGQNVFNTGLSVADIIQQYIQKHSPLTMPATGRITVKTTEEVMLVH